MKKKVLCLAMALVMLAGGSLTAHAEELKGQDGWRAEFNGKKIVSNFDSGTLADRGRQCAARRQHYPESGD